MNYHNCILDFPNNLQLRYALGIFKPVEAGVICRALERLSLIRMRKIRRLSHNKVNLYWKGTQIVIQKRLPSDLAWRLVLLYWWLFIWVKDFNTFFVRGDILFFMALLCNGLCLIILSSTSLGLDLTGPFLGTIIFLQPAKVFLLESFSKVSGSLIWWLKKILRLFTNFLWVYTIVPWCICYQ